MSGNRNFEGRISPHIKANYLASPPLVVAFALAGTIDIDINKESVTVKIALKRRTKNHVGSMYLGALSVGADITSAMLALELIKESKKKIIPIFKDFHADYYKRAEGDVHFVCDEGRKIRKIVKEVENSNKRINEKIIVNAYVPTVQKEPVATFTLTLSLKAY